MVALAQPAVPALPRRPPSGERRALAQWIEQSALHDLFAAASPALRARTGLFVTRSPGLLCFGAPGVPSLIVNRVFLDGAALGASGSALPAAALPGALHRYERRGVDRYLLHVCAQADQLAAQHALHAAGLRPYHRAWVKLARDDQPVAEVEAPLEVDLCRLAEAEAFAALVTQAFGVAPDTAPLLVALVQRPRWHVYVARDRGVPVAAGALFVQGEVAHLGLGATSAAYRGQGLQRALLARRLRTAHALGCRMVASETGVALPGEPNPSYDNLRALGLQVLETRTNYVRPGTSWR